MADVEAAPSGVPARTGSFDGAGRLVDYWATVYLRTWKGSVVSSFVVPLLYILALGVLLGGFIEGDPETLEGATSYLAFVAPGMLAAQVMMTAIGEMTYPVMAMVKWRRIYYSMIATPLSVGDIVMSQLGFTLFRVGTVSAVFLAVMAPFGVFVSLPGVIATFFVMLLTGLAFASPIFALSARLQNESAYALVFRLGMIPLFLFSGCVLPDHQPQPGDGVVGPGHAAVAQRRPVADARPRPGGRRVGADPRRLPRGDGSRRLVAHRAAPGTAADLVSVLNRTAGRQLGAQLGRAESTRLLLLRNYIAYRGAWWIFVTGFLEPVFYLFSIGVGVGKLVEGFEFNGATIPYAEFVAPGMLAASAMNGSVLDSTFNFFFKLKYNKLFDQMLATPLTTSDVARGELSWSLLRGGVYSLAFLLVMVAMGLVHSWWALLAAPAALLIGFAFGGAAMALTTYMRSWQDFEYVTLGTLPLFLFSGTFFPITAFPELAPVGGGADPPLPRGGARPRAHHRCADLGLGVLRGLPGRHGAGRPDDREPSAAGTAADLIRSALAQSPACHPHRTPASPSSAAAASMSSSTTRDR